MAVKSLKLMADFETTTDPTDVRVWGSCVVDIETGEPVLIENSINALFEYLKDKHSVCYYHNLKFDGEFIIYYLLTHGFKYSEVAADRTFSTLITDTGIFYSITVIFEKMNKKYKKVTFYDSLKKLPFKVATIAKAFELDMEKLSIDYEAPRPVGHVLTPEETEYIKADCVIVAKALKIQMDKGLKKMTNASDAMSWYKGLNKRQFERRFPVFPFELDADIRRGYKGGYVYLNPKHRNRRGLQGLTLDVNSLYPWAMYTQLLPWGYPIFFEGEPEPDENFPLYIVRIECSFELKPDHLPTIQLKNNRAFVETEYLTSSNDEIVEMTVTNVDLQLMKDHYVLGNLEYKCGWKFKGAHDMFKEYIDHWMHIKETTTGAMRQLAKLMLNSLYGRFALNPKAWKKVPYLEDNVVKYDVIKDEESAKRRGVAPPELRDPVYTAMGAFITAYAREKTIRSGQAVYDRFIYADTDSLHLIGYDIPEGLEVHPTKLGAWKDEGHFTDSKYIRAKTYMETMYEIEPDSLRSYAKNMQRADWIRREPDGVHYGLTKVTCAGMPDTVKEQVTYENFKTGTTFDGKLVPRRYPGGIVLTNSTFTIK